MNFQSIIQEQNKEFDRRLKDEKQAKYNIDHSKKQKSVSEIVGKYNLHEMSSDYLNMSSYYFDSKKKYLWCVVNTDFNDMYFHKPSLQEYEHIGKLNNLDLKNYYKQPAILQ